MKKVAPDVAQRIHAVRDEYADRVRSEAEIWESGSLYEEMAKHAIALASPDCHFTHLDCGCGPGNLLLAMAKNLLENDRTFTIFGVDANVTLLDHAYEKARSIEGLEVILNRASALVSGGLTKKSRRRIRRTFNADAKALNEIRQNCVRQLVLIEDDLRAGNVLTSALKRGAPGGLNSVSQTLEGTSGDMIALDLQVESVSDFQDREEETRETAGRIIDEVRHAVYRLSAQYLATHGHYLGARRQYASANLDLIKNRIHLELMRLGLSENLGIMEVSPIFDDITPVPKFSSLPLVDSEAYLERLRLDRVILRKL